MPRAVILTALPVEYQAVRNRLIELEEKLHPLGTVYQQGKFIAKGQEWEVGIAEVGTGNAEAAAEVERAIAYFQPNIILFVGIAGGIKDVAIGDVVVATKVYKYESGKEVTEKFLTRPKAEKSAYSLVQRAKFEAKQEKWLQQPKVFVGPIVAGEKVIASRKSAIFQFLRKSYNDAIAVEMEGFGFLNAAFAHPKIPAIVIRGISDLIEGKNDDSVEPEEIRQEKASQHASAFAFEMLSKLKITPSLQSIVPRVTQSVGWLPSVASCAMIAFGGFKLIQGELEQLTAILLAVGFVSLLSICLYVWFKENRIDGSSNRVLPVKQYSKKTRQLALVGLFAVALLMVVSGRSWYYQQSLLKNQVVVLVANFKSLQSENRGVTEEIIRQLGDALEEYDDVEVQALNEEITAQQGRKVACAKAAKHHADIVLWGWYEESDKKAKVTAKFEVLENRRFLCSFPTKPLTQPIAKLESFEIQTQLSEEMSYLTLLIIGLVRYEAKDYDGAIERFTKALAFVPDAEQAIVQDNTIYALYSYRGLAYRRKREIDRAIADYTQVLKIHPDDDCTYINRGNAYSDKGELDKAIADFNQALQINPEYAEAYNNRGFVYSDKGELEQAIADYTQALRVNPEYATAYNNRGNVYSDKGELEQAIADFNQALQINPKLVEAYNNRGNAYRRKRELDQAIADYTQALKINPELAEAYNNRGNAYSDKRELEQAIADFNRALKINPKFAGAYNNRGIAYSDKGELDQAIADYTQALKINPELAEAYNNRGNAYSDKRELDRAIADYTQALKINPEYVKAYSNRGAAYYNKGELDRAIADYTQSLKINPEVAEAYNNRGLTYSDKGELDKAIADFNRALRINPQYAAAYANRGIAYSKLGNKQKAIQDFQKAAKLFAEQGDTAIQKTVLELLKQLQQD